MDNSKSHTTFIMKNPTHGGFSFDSYFDEDGNQQSLVIGIDKHGLNIVDRIKFKAGHRSIIMPNRKKDINGRSYVEHIRNSPFCDSKDVDTGYFIEHNPERDAKIMLDDEKMLFNAKSVALGSKGKELFKLASFAGYHGDNEDIALQSLLQLAENNPQRLIDASKNKDTEFVSLINKAISLNVLVLKGSIVEWMPETNIPVFVGANKDQAKAKLMTDKKLYAAICEDVNRLDVKK